MELLDQCVISKEWVSRKVKFDSVAWLDVLKFLNFNLQEYVSID